MKFSILINTHNQRDYLLRCINSCMNQSCNGKYEIIVCDTSSESNGDIIKKDENKNKYKYKKLFYYHKKRFSRFPAIDQLFKIRYAFKKSKGQFILLLDGDDFFLKNKLDFVSKVINQNQIVYHDLPIYYFEKKAVKKNSTITFFKKFLFYKKFINNWPIVLGTSCIFTNREVLIKFFNNKNIFKYNLLAIDSKLAIFSKKFYEYKIIKKYLTYKSVNDYNLDSNFNNFFSKIYWIRRNQQLNYSRSIGSFELNINFVVTKIVFFFIRVF